LAENKIYFSDFFDVSRTIIEDYGAMDISLLNDLPLFIDPFLIFCSEDQRCHRIPQILYQYLRDSFCIFWQLILKKATVSEEKLQFTRKICSHGRFGSNRSRSSLFLKTGSEGYIKNPLTMDGYHKTSMAVF